MSREINSTEIMSCMQLFAFLRMYAMDQPKEVEENQWQEDATHETECPEQVHLLLSSIYLELIDQGLEGGCSPKYAPLLCHTEALSGTSEKNRGS